MLAAASCGSPRAAEELATRTLASATRHDEIIPLLPDGRTAARAVVSSARGTCILLVDGALWCAGAAGAERAVFGAFKEMPVPPVRTIVGTSEFWVALTEQGEVFDWGNPPFDEASLLPRSRGVTDAREVAVAEHTVCVRFDDRVTCQGERDRPGWTGTVAVAAKAISVREFDRCYATDRAVHCAGSGAPRARAIPHVEQLVASTTTTCALTRDHRVVCWRGGEGSPELDLFRARPFAHIEANARGICARTTSGATECVPDEEPATPSASKPLEALMQRHQGASSVGLASPGVCFVEAGVAYCAESSEDGELVPRAMDLGDVASLRAAREVAVGDEHVCLLGVDGGVRCWGNNGTLVGAAIGSIGAPERLRDLPPVARLAVGPFTTCIVTRAERAEPGGRVLCAGGWAHQGNVECSTESPCALAPELVTTGAVDVSLGDAFGCVLDADGGVRCWGRNDYGQLGAGDTIASVVPRPVVDGAGTPLSRVRKVVAADLHACAILEAASGGATLSCWGYDDPGEQGRPLDSPGVLTVATPLPMPRPVLDVSARCVLLEGGEVRCWGARDGGFSTTPARVGVCDAERLIGEACAVGPRGVTCVEGASSTVDDARPAESGSASPVALGSVSARDGRVCAVDAAQRLHCRRVADPVARVGPTVPMYVAAPSSACPRDPPEHAGQPFAAYQGNQVSGQRGVMKLADDKVRTIVESLRAAAPVACEGPNELGGVAPQRHVELSFFDARGRTTNMLSYFGACDAVLDEFAKEQGYLRPTRAGSALFRELSRSLNPPEGAQ